MLLVLGVYIQSTSYYLVLHVVFWRYKRLDILRLLSFLTQIIK